MESGENHGEDVTEYTLRAWEIPTRTTRTTGKGWIWEILHVELIPTYLDVNTLLPNIDHVRLLWRKLNRHLYSMHIIIISLKGGKGLMSLPQSHEHQPLRTVGIMTRGSHNRHLDNQFYAPSWVN